MNPARFAPDLRGRWTSGPLLMAVLAVAACLGARPPGRAPAGGPGLTHACPPCDPGFLCPPADEADGGPDLATLTDPDNKGKPRDLHRGPAGHLPPSPPPGDLVGRTWSRLPPCSWAVILHLRC